MAAQSQPVSFDLGKDLLKMVDQRAKQQGINRSEYVREAIYLEFFLSGDLEATKFVLKRVGARVKNVIAEKLRDSEVREARKILAEET